MAQSIIPELNYLLRQVEKKLGRDLCTSSDFEALSIIIEKENGELLSSSTLKRLYGYVTMKPTPRKSTLDILSRYLGFRNFSDFVQNLKNNSEFSSQFFSNKAIMAEEMKAGDTLRIGWEPDRVVQLRYLGESEFEVMESINSQLCAGDRFFQAHFIPGYPLYISSILRNGEHTPSYIAGRLNGLNLVKKD